MGALIFCAVLLVLAAVFFWNSLPGQVLVGLQQHGAPVVSGVLPMEDPPYYTGRWAIR